MHAKIAPLPDAAPAEFSVIRGGPFYSAQVAIRLIRPNQWNFNRRIPLLIVITWLPLFVLTAVLNPGGLHSLLRDYRVHARLLIAVPVLLLGELLMETRFRAVFAHIRQGGLLEVPDLEYMDGVVATLVRFRDSFWPELAVLVLLIIHTATSYRGLVDPVPWLARGSGADLQLSAAGWYAVLVSAPVFQFLLGLSLWKWLLWTIFAFNFSRRNLKLVPSHPDERGGLGFLGLTVAAFAPIALATTTVIGATWRHDILQHGAHLRDFRLPAVVLVVVIALVAVGPLAFFVSRLAALRRTGITEYSALGQIQSTEFHEKWIHHRAGHEVEFLQAPESTALADFSQAYERIKRLKPFPADKEALIPLVIAVAVPALPVILAQVPLAVVLKDLLKALR
jgi:hypothetical protein